MKSETQVLAEVARIDLSIDETRARMEQTENQIQTLAKLNEGRRQYLRQLGQARAELLTFELKLE